MPFPSGRTVYTFTGISFCRQREDDMLPWFFPETQYTADPVLGGTQVYLDIGSDSVAPLSFRARVLTTTDRGNLRLARGTTGTLVNTRGRTATATLVKATPMDGIANQLNIDLTFIYRP